MMMIELKQTMKMAEFLEKAPSLLGVFTRMGFPFSFGDATVADVCRANGVDAETFLLICRVYATEDYRPSAEELEEADLSVIVRYLSLSHQYYMDVAMKDLAAAIGRMIVPCREDTQRIVWKFFADFKEELRKHFEYEEQQVFPLAGHRGADIPEEDHSRVEETLEDLKNILMSHLPADADRQEAYKVLSSIRSLQDDIRRHIILEETALEGRAQDGTDDHTLTAREREVLACIATGKLNKEIADELNISVHTVITHRKNITRKTGIKTVAGLTVYALLNNLVTMEQVNEA